MSIERINPPTLPAPPGYSQLVVAGSTLYIAGQVALDQDGKLVGAGDFAAQAVQTFKNVMAALEAGGATARDLVKLNTYVTDLSGLADFRRARDQFLDPAHPPTSTLVQVAKLFRPEFLIEIEAIASLQP